MIVALATARSLVQSDRLSIRRATSDRVLGLGLNMRYRLQAHLVDHFGLGAVAAGADVHV
jgi:hypothetical protein